ncbi:MULTISPECIES: arsenate reductase (glutaredoxin) [Flavobacterium]|uniref:Arsenate reductase (Glutaredoxin) n=1 Tax=Flavobacterium keumense TaxID=1306518 RepID=A0ABY8N3Z8_9FLAO|nr:MULTISPECIES: arsenate reductase (glutaredoxin) [Flavobacterium]WGK94373.1 arsenate reductase (glutaredoxin) [Flavobacterium keumense]
MIQIYHNPRCGKSRNCLAFVTEKETEVTIIKYLENPPSEKEIKEVLQKLNFKPIQLVRTKESIWIENYKNKTLTDDAIIQAMAEHPILIERPIVIKGDKAIIGRIPEEVAQFI